MMSARKSLCAAAVLAGSMASAIHAAPTNPPNDCAGLPTTAQLEAALTAVVGANGGLNFPIWATVVNRYGVVCSVATTGTSMDDAWLASRAISAQKANTANSLSRPAFALSTGNLYAATQPGGSLFGLQFSNPVDPRVAFRGDSTKYGTSADPMIGLKPGGVNVFGGGLALYSATGKLGAVGVSGDTSCADHNVAWKLRKQLSTVGGTVAVANRVPGGVRAAPVGTTNQPQPVKGGSDDGIMYGTGGFTQVACGNSEASIALPALD